LQLLAFDGNRTDSQNNVLYPEQTCGLVACSGASVLTCGAEIDDVNYTNQTYFSDKLTLSGSFSSDKIVPLTIEGKGNYFPETFGLQFSINKDGERYFYSMRCLRMVQSLN
jgi:Vanin C-terminal domain